MEITLNKEEFINGLRYILHESQVASNLIYHRNYGDAQSKIDDVADLIKNTISEFNKIEG